MAPQAATPPYDTRERILAAAAELFAVRGFEGTSTRHIAAAVGIRQPSLFHHFPTKQAILTELLDRDLGPAVYRGRRIRASAGSAAARLHAYVAGDVAALIGFPFDARGLYRDEVLEDEAFATQRACREALHCEIEALVAEGCEGSEFRDVDPAFAQQVIHAMTIEIILQVATRGSSRLADRPKQIADFVLRGLLAEPAALDDVRSEAARIADRPTPSDEGRDGSGGVAGRR